MQKTYRIILAIVVPVFLAFLTIYVRDAILSGREEIGACVPVNYDVSREVKQMTVTWETKEKCSGYISYSEEGSDSEVVAFGESGSTKENSHLITIEALDSSATYKVKIVSDGEEYGEQGEAITVLP